MQFDYRIDILRSGIPIGEVRCSSAVIRFDKNADVTKGMQLVVSADDIPMNKVVSGIGETPTSFVFDMFSDRLRPVLIVDGQEYPLGVYMIMAAPMALSDIGSSYRLETYDETMILKQAKYTQRTNYTAGSSYLNVINSILTTCGFTKIMQDNTNATLTEDIEVAPDTSYLEVINQLLDGINYEHIHADNNGWIHLKKASAKAEVDHYYSASNGSIKLPITRTTDVYDLPNVITGIVSLPEQEEPLYYTKENTDPNSAISIPRRGYRVTKVYRLRNIADLQTLKDYIDRKYLEASQITETVEIDTYCEGGHEFGDTVQIQTDLVAGLFNEIEWEMTLGPKGGMKHKVERRVFT